MTFVTPNLDAVINRMPKLSQMVPSFARATLRAVAPGLAEKSIGPLIARYDTADLLERLIIPVTEEDPDTDAVRAVIDHCDSFIKDNDWVGLADYLRQMDQTRVAVPSGRRILEIVLHYLRDDQSEIYEAPNEVNFETSYIYSPRLLDALEAAHLENPDHYMIAALLGRLHLDSAWAARGSQPQEDLDAATRNAVKSHVKIVQDIVTRYDPIAYNSTLLAEIQYGMVSLKFNDLERMMNAFDDWAELDPGALTPYRHHAFFLQTLHATEDDDIVETEARRAISLSSDTVGDGAYTLMHMHVLPLAPENFAKLDAALFVKGFDDLMQSLNGNPVRLNYLLQEMVECFPLEHSEGYAKLSRVGKAKSALIRSEAAPIIRENIQMLYAVAWELDEEEFLHAVAPSFEAELSRGATVEITDGGILITEAPYAG